LDKSPTTDLDSAILDEDKDYEMVLSSSLGTRLDSPNLECTHNTSLGPLQEKRHVSSARETAILQGRGLKQISAYLNDLKLASTSTNLGTPTTTGEPHVYGLKEHYQFMNLWGATCARVH
jgi:hypothetical protein